MDDIKFNNVVFETIFKDVDNRVDTSNAMANLINELSNEFNIDKAYISNFIKIGYKCALVDMDTLFFNPATDEQTN